MTNKTILVTGGGSGIGYATAKFLSKVIIAGRNAKKLEKAGKELEIDYIICGCRRYL